jgi:hypothetical protein
MVMNSTNAADVSIHAVSPVSIVGTGAALAAAGSAGGAGTWPNTGTEIHKSKSSKTMGIARYMILLFERSNI